jgi:hypothetical protein
MQGVGNIFLPSALAIDTGVDPTSVNETQAVQIAKGGI